MTIATLVFPMLKSTLRIGPQAGIYGKKKPNRFTEWESRDRDAL